MQKIFSIISTLLFLVAVAVPAYAADEPERNPGDVELNIWGLSKHLQGAPKGRQWNEFNPGVGARVYFHNPTNIDGLETFVEADYMARNSTGGQFIMAGVGVQYPVGSISGVKFFVGASGGVSRYNNEWEGRTLTSLAGYPFIAARSRDVTVTLGYIPKVQISGMSSYSTLFMFLGMKI
jgi:hypothetical protein